jgi:uncharacterized protein (TIGR03435 family)
LYLEPPLECMAGVAGSNLRRRIRAIMTHQGTEGVNMYKKLVLAAASVAAVAGPVIVGLTSALPGNAQSQPPAPKFEVASIRPCENNGPVPGLRNGGVGVTPNRLHVHCVSVGFLVQAAYVTFGDYGYAQVTGGPTWIHSEQFDIEAETTGNPSARTLQGPMLQALLEDRFKLKIRREIIEVPVYDLNVSKGGFKLQPMKEGSCVAFDLLNAQTNARTDLKATLADLSRSCGRGGLLMQSNPAKAEFHGMTLDTVANYLSRPASGLGRPVINKTGITGMFDFDFEFSPEQVVGVPGDAPSDPSGAPSIFAALEKAAGLKLDRAKGPGTFFVIEAVERPSEN